MELKETERSVENARFQKLCNAAYRGQEDAIAVLGNIRTIVNRKHNGETPLIMAARKGHAEAAQKLLSCGAQTFYSDTNGFDALYYAVKNDHAACAGVLIDARASLLITSRHNQLNWNLLHVAASQGHTALVPILAAAGVDVNKHDSKRRTPYDIAVTKGHHACAQALIEAGAVVPTPGSVPAGATRVFASPPLTSDIVHGNVPTPQ